MVRKRLPQVCQIKELVYNARYQYLIFFGLSLGIAALTGMLYISNSHVFQRFFGNLNPLITIFLLILSGIFLLTFLLSKGWFVIYQKKNLKGLLLAFSPVILLASIIILVDIKVIFPKDINILFPQSLLFYPAIGYVVEILFHLLPLSFVLIVLTSLIQGKNHHKIIWTSILIVSLLEPVYQTIGLIGQYPLWTVAYVGLHVFLINLLQLAIFKRYDFISMYSFRLVYYILWHIIWGYLRLRLLF